MQFREDSHLLRMDDADEVVETMGVDLHMGDVNEVVDTMDVDGTWATLMRRSTSCLYIAHGRRR